MDHYEEDWARLWWVRLDGTGRVEEGGETRERALGLLAAKYEQYRQQMPAGPAVVIEVTTWRRLALTTSGFTDPSTSSPGRASTAGMCRRRRG